MERTIKQVIFPTPKPIEVTRVAAYARVTSGKDAMLHSLAAQVSYYSSLIQKHPGWLYCGVYADEALTGTKDNRENFQRLLAACRNGEVDLIITKSISRFARNTVTLLESVRELKQLGVDVYFEEQNIHTMSADGELMLTILASYAQEESRSASENQKWRIQKNFQSGKPWNMNMYGYRQIDGQLVIVQEEAAIVQDIFSWYLDGLGVQSIANRLKEKGIQDRFGNAWTDSGISKMLKNYTYTGNLLLQRRFRTDHITKRTVDNKGELPMYQVEGTHEAIIPMETFEGVQQERAQRARKFHESKEAPQKYPFSGLIRCGCCGKNYRRKTTPVRVIWQCDTYNTRGKAECPRSKAIPEETLIQVASEVLGMEQFDGAAVRERVEQIDALEGNILIFTLKDGSMVTATWTDRSRSESWTPEMRAETGRKTKERRQGNA